MKYIEYNDTLYKAVDESVYTVANEVVKAVKELETKINRIEALCKKGEGLAGSDDLTKRAFRGVHRGLDKIEAEIRIEIREYLEELQA